MLIYLFIYFLFFFPSQIDLYRKEGLAEESDCEETRELKINGVFIRRTALLGIGLGEDDGSSSSSSSSIV